MANTRELVKSVLGLEHDDFDIKDSNDRYILVRQKGRFGSAHNELRGTIVDIDHRCVVTGPSDPIIECTERELTIDDGHYTVHVDEVPEGAVHGATFGDLVGLRCSRVASIPVDDVELSYYAEGTNILVWQDDKLTTRVSSHSKLDIIESRPSWGDSRPFYDYFALNNVRLDKIFRANGKVSRVVHRFIIQHPELGMYCKRNSKGNIAYDGHSVASRRTLAPGVDFDDEPVALEEFLPEYTHESTATTTLAVVLGTPITLADANDFLKYGYYEPWELPSDSRICTGEVVKMRHRHSGEVYRIKSTAWQWRYGMQKYPNIAQNMYYLLNFAHRNDYYKKIKFPRHHYQNDAQLLAKAKSGEPIVVYSTDGDLVDTSTVHGRLYNIALSAILCVPIKSQLEAVTGLARYLAAYKTISTTIPLILANRADCGNRTWNRIQHKLERLLKQTRPLTEHSCADFMAHTLMGNDVYSLECDVRDFVVGLARKRIVHPNS